MYLNYAEIWRGGVTSNYHTKESGRVRVDFYPEDSKTQNGSLSLHHSIASKGGGATSITLFIDANSFDQIASMMVQANRKKAITAFAKALLEAAEES